MAAPEAPKRSWLLNKLTFAVPRIDGKTKDEIHSRSLGRDGGSSADSDTRLLFEDLKKQDIIRLIKLDPKAASKSEGYTLKSFPLKKCPRFHALSYCWGESERSSVVTCNGQNLRISSHLSQGLRELQSIKRFSKAWFWIDQISVNQENLAERNHQVQLMKSIYSKSLGTVIWLHQDQDHDYEGAFNLMTKIYNNRDKKRVLQYLVDNSQQLFGEPDLEHLGLPPLSDESWTDAVYILDNPWFRRMWVVQEALLSRKTPIVIHAGQSRNWSHIVAAASWIANKQVFAHGNRFVPGLAMAEIIKRTFSEATRQASLESLLLLLGFQEAKDGRDKIFAALSLAADLQQLPSLPSRLRPDYTKPLEVVYRDATRYVVSSSQTLDVLSYGRLGCHDFGNQTCVDNDVALPSWVPDYDQGIRSVSGRWYQDTGKKKKYRTQRFEDCYSSSGITLQTKNSSDDGLLILKGLSLTQVSWCAENSADLNHEEYINWAKECSYRLHPSTYSSSKSFIEDFLRVTSWGRVEDGVADWWDYITSHVSTDSSHSLSHFPKTNEDCKNGDAKRVAWTVRNDLISNRVFITEQQQLGIGSKDIQKGDMICVLFGGSRPFALRPCGDHYHIISDCYINGLMKGEAVDAWDAGEIKAEWFTLR